MRKHFLLATTLLALASPPLAFAHSEDHHTHGAPAAASQQAPLEACT